MSTTIMYVSSSGSLSMISPLTSTKLHFLQYSIVVEKLRNFAEELKSEKDPRPMFESKKHLWLHLPPLDPVISKFDQDIRIHFALRTYGGSKLDSWTVVLYRWIQHGGTEIRQPTMADVALQFNTKPGVLLTPQLVASMILANFP